MKRLAVPLLLTLTVFMGAAALMQSRQAQTKTREATELREEIQRTNERAKESAEKIASLEEKSKILADESAVLRERLQAASPSATAAAPPHDEQPASKDQDSKNGMGDVLKNLLKNPEMKKVMAAQQAAVLPQLYSDFVKAAHMTPQQAERFYEMLTKRQMEMMDKAGDMLKDKAAGNDLMHSAAEEKKAFDAQLSELLGADGVSQFHAYEKTVADHMAVNQFSQKLASTGTPLSADQNWALVQVMSEERVKQPASPPQPQPAARLNMSDEDIQQMFQRQEETNARIRTRALSLLTADQMKAFEQFQKQQLEIQKMGVTMARQMFGGKKNSP